MDAYTRVLEQFGTIIFRLVTTVEGAYYATFVFLFFLLFAIFVAALKMVPPFEKDGRTNKSGKAVALALSALTTFSIYGVGRGVDPRSVLERVLPIYGIYSGAVLAILFFAIIYFGFSNKEEGRWQLAMAGIGFGMAIVGYFATFKTIQAFGWIVGAVGIILYMIIINNNSEEKKG